MQLKIGVLIVELKKRFYLRIERVSISLLIWLSGLVAIVVVAAI